MFERPKEQTQEVPLTVDLQGGRVKSHTRHSDKGKLYRVDEYTRRDTAKKEGWVIKKAAKGRQKRAKRARESFQVVNKTVQAIARHWEDTISEITRGKNMNDVKKNVAYDVFVPGKYLIEVRTIQKRKVNRMTVHYAAGCLKDDIAMGLASLEGVPKGQYRAFAVIVDVRSERPEFYVRECNFTGKRWKTDYRGRPLMKEVHESGAVLVLPEKVPGFGIGSWDLKSMQHVSQDDLRRIFK